jgi:hypothetical protein
MALSSAVLSMLYSGSARTGSVDFSFLARGASSSGVATADAGAIKAALVNAEKNEAKQLAQIAKDPIVQKDLARYERVVKSAKTMDDVLNDPVARKVFMTANGLKANVDYIGLAKKALNSNPDDRSSPAAKLAAINGTWYDTVKKWPTGLAGIGVLQVSDALAEIKADYIAEKRLDVLDQQMPGLGSAVLFKDIAANLEDATDVLGSPLGREVITVAFNIPKQIAVQSMVAQEKAINQRLNPARLADPQYADMIAQRYLIMLNGGLGGVTA